MPLHANGFRAAAILVFAIASRRARRVAVDSFDSAPPVEHPR
jgi:hypothetical protein